MIDKIMKFMTITGIDTLIEQVIANTMVKFREQFEDGYGNKELPEGPNKALVAIEASLRNKVPELKQDIVNVYQKYFTEDMLDSIIMFYESDAGKALSSSGVMIQDEVGKATHNWEANAIKSAKKEIADCLGVEITE